MKHSESKRINTIRTMNSRGIIFAGFAVLIITFIVVYGTRLASGAVIPQSRISSGMKQISTTELEKQYGMHLNLVAVTAGGGMVDVRLKVLDAQKAAQLLKDQKDYPVIQVGNNGFLLKVPEDSQQDVKNLQNNGMIFILAPNVHSAVKPGTQVTIQIGNIQLEPVSAQ